MKRFYLLTSIIFIYNQLFKKKERKRKQKNSKINKLIDGNNALNFRKLIEFSKLCAGIKIPLVHCNKCLL